VGRALVLPLVAGHLELLGAGQPDRHHAADLDQRHHGLRDDADDPDRRHRPVGRGGAGAGGHHHRDDPGRQPAARRFGPGPGAGGRVGHGRGHRPVQRPVRRQDQDAPLHHHPGLDADRPGSGQAVQRGPAHPRPRPGDDLLARGERATVGNPHSRADHAGHLPAGGVAAAPHAVRTAHLRHGRQPRGRPLHRHSPGAGGGPRVRDLCPPRGRGGGDPDFAVVHGGAGQRPRLRVDRHRGRGGRRDELHGRKGHDRRHADRRGDHRHPEQGAQPGRRALLLPVHREGRGDPVGRLPRRATPQVAHLARSTFFR